MNAILTLEKTNRQKFFPDQTPNTRLDRIPLVNNSLFFATKTHSTDNELIKEVTVAGDKWLCDSFETEDTSIRFVKPIEVAIKFVDGYLEARFDELGISVMDKSFDGLKEYFKEALMFNYCDYTGSENDILTSRAIKYKEWFLASTVRA